MELKHLRLIDINITTYPFNRTFMELKPYRPDDY